jgi:hypothetical protein
MGISKQKHLKEIEEEAYIEEAAEEMFLDNIADKEPEEDFDEEEAMIQADEDAYIEKEIATSIYKQEELQRKIQEIRDQKIADFYHKVKNDG